jgi:hypothetical protein
MVGSGLSLLSRLAIDRFPHKNLTVKRFLHQKRIALLSRHFSFGKNLMFRSLSQQIRPSLTENDVYDFRELS